ncbi:hypothetical protein BV330_05594 [Pseudomonas syringae pv. actinidiae]|nr:hypothetical protein BV330_05594 [Pseudomonas syringae pv. actinidiae]
MELPFREFMFVFRYSHTALLEFQELLTLLINEPLTNIFLSKFRLKEVPSYSFVWDYGNQGPPPIVG